LGLVWIAPGRRADGDPEATRIANSECEIQIRHSEFLKSRTLVSIIARVAISERTVGSAIGGVLLAASILLILCNWWDWDIFLTFNEVDRRSWVLDHQLPIWSYQFCGGITRIGDPQSFGLSPLFFVVVVFGSFWGSKLLTILSLAYGFWISGRLLQLVATGGGDTPQTSSVIHTLATLFVASNFFLWHLSVGHLSYLSFYLALGIVYYTLAAYSRGLGRAETVMAALVVWQHFSGAFFHSTAYLLVPFYVAFGLYAVALAFLGPGWAHGLRALGRCLPFHTLGALPASYKLVAVWRYHAEFPRQLEQVNETFTPFQLLAAQIVPTLGNRWPVPIDMGGWGLGENSAFSLLPIALLLLVLRRRSASPGANQASPPANPLAPFVWIYAVVAGSFAVGGFSEVAPFTLLNSTVFGGSLRIIGRFGIGITLCLTLLCALLVRGARPALSPRTCLVLLVAALANLLTFSGNASIGETMRLASLPTSAKAEMKTLRNNTVWGSGARLIPGREFETRENTSQMYAMIRAGEAILNCYNPLPHPRVDGKPREARVSMLASHRGDVDRACLEESYFTQNRFRIGPSCPNRVCLHFRWINIHAPEAGIRRDPERHLFCRTDG